uniref:IP15866p n=1 Tax=Drosophila melanogaster TaxID=7227 RepID=Q1RL02_DROME|nr:IP15866p [Drosophila melanogaster]
MEHQEEIKEQHPKHNYVDIVHLVDDSPPAFYLRPQREDVQECLLALVKDFYSFAHFTSRFFQNLRLIDSFKCL